MQAKRCSRHFQVCMRTGFVALLFLMHACSGLSPKPTSAPPAKERDFTMALPPKPPAFAGKEDLDKAKSENGPYEYRLGPGDVISMKIWRRPELSHDRIIVSPDGNIEISRIGLINVNGNTAEDVQRLIMEKLSVFYVKPEITIQVLEFQNNRAFVLGNVNNPGVVRFPGRGTLLEGLALAGGVSKGDQMTQCSIIRGSDSVIWIDLHDLLKYGNMSLNAPIRNNDVIYVPIRNEEMVYVMGEVKTPGAFRLQDGMSVFRAIMLAGGLNRTANTKKVYIIRQHDLKGAIVEVNLDNLVEKADFSKNYTLMPEDIVYVSPAGMTKFNYAIEKIMPSIQFLSLGASTAESFGIMQKLRQSLWGQQGFVNGSSSSSGSTQTSGSASSTSTSGQ